MGGHQSISRIFDGSCRSRQISDKPRTKVIANLIKHGMKPSAFGKVGINLLIPCLIVFVSNKSGQFRQIAWRKLLNSLF